MSYGVQSDVSRPVSVFPKGESKKEWILPGDPKGGVVVASGGQVAHQAAHQLSLARRNSAPAIKIQSAGSASQLLPRRQATLEFDSKAARARLIESFDSAFAQMKGEDLDLALAHAKCLGPKFDAKNSEGPSRAFYPIATLPPLDFSQIANAAHRGALSCRGIPVSALTQTLREILHKSPAQQCFEFLLDVAKFSTAPQAMARDRLVATYPDPPHGSAISPEAWAQLMRTAGVAENDPDRGLTAELFESARVQVLKALIDKDGPHKRVMDEALDHARPLMTNLIEREKTRRSESSGALADGKKASRASSDGVINREKLAQLVRALAGGSHSKKAAIEELQAMCARRDEMNMVFAAIKGQGMEDLAAIAIVDNRASGLAMALLLQGARSEREEIRSDVRRVFGPERQIALTRLAMSSERHFQEAFDLLRFVSRDPKFMAQNIRDGFPRDGWRALIKAAIAEGNPGAMNILALYIPCDWEVYCKALGTVAPEGLRALGTHAVSSGVCAQPAVGLLKALIDTDSSANMSVFMALGGEGVRILAKRGMPPDMQLLESLASGEASNLGVRSALRLDGLNALADRALGADDFGAFQALHLLGSLAESPAGLGLIAQLVSARPLTPNALLGKVCGNEALKSGIMSVAALRFLLVCAKRGDASLRLQIDGALSDHQLQLLRQESRSSSSAEKRQLAGALLDALQESGPRHLVVLA